MTGLKTNERPGTRASVKYVRSSAYKAREILDLIRGRSYGEAAEILEFSERSVSQPVKKVLDSAVANAEHNDALDAEDLYVSACFADEGPTLKRWRPRARGRATPIRKRTCHITIILTRYDDEHLEARREREADRGRSSSAQASEARRRRVAQAPPPCPEAPKGAPWSARYVPQKKIPPTISFSDPEAAAEFDRWREIRPRLDAWLQEQDCDEARELQTVLFHDLIHQAELAIKRPAFQAREEAKEIDDLGGKTPTSLKAAARRAGIRPERKVGGGIDWYDKLGRVSSCALESELGLNWGPPEGPPGLKNTALSSETFRSDHALIKTG